MVDHNPTRQQINVNRDWHDKRNEQRSNSHKKNLGMGMELQDLLDLVSTVMSIATADTRYEARKNPVVIEIKIQNDPEAFVITNARIKDNKLVLIVDPEF